MKKALLEKIVDIEKSIVPGSLSPSLHAGEMGKTIFYSHLSSYLQSEKYTAEIERSILSVFDSLNTKYINPTFCTGLAGILFGIEYLKRKGLIQLEENFDDSIAFLKQSALQYGMNGNFDFLHGAGGIVYCLLTMQEKDEDFINLWLELLWQHAQKNEEGLFVWETVIDATKGSRGLNLSLSHGISSQIVLLSETLKRYPDNKLARQLLEGSIGYLLSCKNKQGTRNKFPSYIDENRTGDTSRLSWCYGDLGNAIALWRAGCTVNHEQWKEEAIEILLFSSQRRDLEKESVIDAGFCHGSAGIAHIFNRFYLETGLKEFDEARLYWAGKTIEMAQFNDGMAGYKFFDGIEKQYTNKDNALDGVVGVALVLLGLLSEKKDDIDWDSCFLMS
jgi:lantibiotic modifying enzyme